SALAHQLGHRALDRIAALAEASHDPGPVLARAVLTHLPLALDARDRDLDPDDRAELGVDVARRRVADLPRRGAGRALPVALVPAGQTLDERAQPPRVLDRAQWPV